MDWIVINIEDVVPGISKRKLGYSDFDLFSEIEES
jgi:hypothetical protein